MTTTEAAKKIGYGESTVRLVARAIGIKKLGRNFWLTEADVRRILARLGPARKRGVQAEEAAR